MATRPWHLGGVATWISAAASVATVILALVASIVGYRVYKVESGRDARAELDRRERAADDRRSQASLVSAWYGRIENQLSTRPTSYLMRLPASYTWGAWVANASNLPIYDAAVLFQFPGVDGAYVGSWSPARTRVVPPYRKELFVALPRDASDLLTEDERQTLEVSLEFRDAAGRYWLRDGKGYLHELTEASQAGPKVTGPAVVPALTVCNAGDRGNAVCRVDGRGARLVHRRAGGPRIPLAPTDDTTGR